MTLPARKFTAFGDYSPELQCCICLDSFEDPVQLPCQHVMCRQCSQSLLHCPQCRFPVNFVTTPIRLVVNLSNEVVVRCKDCAWSGTRGTTSQHTSCLIASPQPSGCRAAPPLNRVDDPEISLAPGHVFEIEPCHAPGMRVTMSSDSPNEEAKIHLWEPTERNCQKFVALAGSNPGTFVFAPLGAQQLCIDDGGGGMRQCRTVRRSSIAANQEWKVAHRGGGTFLLTCAATGFSLEAVDGDAVNGTHIMTFEPSGALHQEFRFLPIDVSPTLGESVATAAAVEPARDDAASSPVCSRAVGAPTLTSGSVVELEPLHAPNMRLGVVKGKDADGSELRLAAYSGSNAQRFRLIQRPNGTFSFFPLCALTRCLDARGDVGAQLCITGWGSSNRNQEWIFEPVARQGATSRLFRITSVATNCLLDVLGSSRQDGGNVVTLPAGPGESLNQIFHVVASPEPNVNASILDGSVYEIEPLHAPGMRVEVNSGMEQCGTKIVINTRTTSNCQKFRVVSRQNGRFSLVPVHCPILSIDDGDAEKAICHAWFWMWGNKNQEWTFEPRGGDDQFVLVCVSRGCALDVLGLDRRPGSFVVNHPKTNGLNQLFRFIPTTVTVARYPQIRERVVDVVEDCVYQIEPQCAPGYRLDVCGVGNRNSVKIQLWECCGNQAQKFRAVLRSHDPPRWGFIPNCAPVRGLDDGGCPRNQCHIWECSVGNTNQQWHVIPTGDGFFVFVCGTTGFVLDVEGGNAALNTRIMTQPNVNGARNQKFRLILD